MCLCYVKVTLTKNLREGLMFLDHHMSTSRRNEKHLKVTFAKFAAAAAVEGSRRVKKDKTETGKIRRYRNYLFAVVDILRVFRSIVHFALQRLK